MTVKVAPQVGERGEAEAKHEVLLVDGCTFFRGRLEEVLEDGGYATTVVGEAEEALESLKSSLPSLVIAELVMPGMDGFEFVSRLREEWSADELPVIIVTEALATESTMTRLRELDCGGYINKFAPPDHVLFLVRDALYPNDEDTRDRKRLAITLGVQYEIDGSSSLAYTYTISGKGLFLRRTQPPEPGKWVRLSFNLPGRESAIIASGRVVRSKQEDEAGASPAGFAVSFDDISAGDEKALELFVGQALRTGL